MPAISLRIDFESGLRLGPGKIALLERIAATGSISAAARSMDMSYKRAWDLVGELNRLFGRPLVDTRAGGPGGGGAGLTPAGRAVIACFRSIETAAGDAAAAQLAALAADISGPLPAGQRTV